MKKRKILAIFIVLVFSISTMISGVVMSFAQTADDAPTTTVGTDFIGKGNAANMAGMEMNADGTMTGFLGFNHGRLQYKEKVDLKYFEVQLLLPTWGYNSSADDVATGIGRNFVIGFGTVPDCIPMQSKGFYICLNDNQANGARGYNIFVRKSFPPNSGADGTGWNAENDKSMTDNSDNAVGFAPRIFENGASKVNIKIEFVDNVYRLSINDIVADMPEATVNAMLATPSNCFTSFYNHNGGAEFSDQIFTVKKYTDAKRELYKTTILDDMLSNLTAYEAAVTAEFSSLDAVSDAMELKNSVKLSQFRESDRTLAKARLAAADAQLQAKASPAIVTLINSSIDTYSTKLAELDDASKITEESVKNVKNIKSAINARISRYGAYIVASEKRALSNRVKALDSKLDRLELINAVSIYEQFTKDLSTATKITEAKNSRNAINMIVLDMMENEEKTSLKAKIKVCDELVIDAEKPKTDNNEESKGGCGEKNVALLLLAPMALLFIKRK